MRKTICIIISIYFCSMSIGAQNKIKDKIYFGGGIGLSLGSYTQIAVNPLVGYKISSPFSVGVSGAYQYIKDNRYKPSYSTYNYGGSVFARYKIFQPIYLHAEYMMLNSEVYNLDGSRNRVWIPMALLGVGLSQKISDNVFVNLQVLFDVLQDQNSPYQGGDPLFSAGIGVGF